MSSEAAGLDLQRRNRQIAAALGVSDTTVGIVRRKLESGSQIGKRDKTIGKDGKARSGSLSRRRCTFRERSQA